MLWTFSWGYIIIIPLGNFGADIKSTTHPERSCKKVKVKLKLKLKALGRRAFLFPCWDRLQSVFCCCCRVRYSFRTKKSVLPCQHDNLQVPISPGWGGAMWVTGLAQGLNTMSTCLRRQQDRHSAYLLQQRTLKLMLHEMELRTTFTV